MNATKGKSAKRLVTFLWNLSICRTKIARTSSSIFRSWMLGNLILVMPWVKYFSIELSSIFLKWDSNTARFSWRIVQWNFHLTGESYRIWIIHCISIELRNNPWNGSFSKRTLQEALNPAENSSSSNIFVFLMHFSASWFAQMILNQQRDLAFF